MDHTGRPRQPNHWINRMNNACAFRLETNKTPSAAIDCGGLYGGASGSPWNRDHVLLQVERRLLDQKFGVAQEVVAGVHGGHQLGVAQEVVAGVSAARAGREVRIIPGKLRTGVVHHEAG